MKQKMNSDNNYQNYRKLLENIVIGKDPCIPFLGIYLNDLSEIDDKFKDYVTDTGSKKKRIDFAKCTLNASIIIDIQKYQKITYSLEDVPELIAYLLNANTLSEKEALERSLSIEKPK
jgi:son of sevenless-like protein